MLNLLRVLTIGAVAASLVGCQPSITLKTITLNPTTVGSGIENHYSQTWECSVPGSGLYTNGLGPETVNSGEAPSGFDDIYNQGAQPFPCNEQEQILYRGHVQFDLSKFSKVVSAELNFGASRSTLNGQPQTPPACVATVLGVSTGTKDEGQGPYYWDYTNPASLTPLSYCQTLTPPMYSIEVGSQVRDWASGAVANNGFIIAGPNLGEPGLPTDNNGNVTFYDFFSLTITYNPALNPLAPQ
jgi:hypothetical protein